MYINIPIHTTNIHRHQLVSLPSYINWYNKCKNGQDKFRPECVDASVILTVEIGNFIDPYALDYPICHHVFDNNEKIVFMHHLYNNIHDSKLIPGLYKDIVNKYDSILYDTSLNNTEKIHKWNSIKTEYTNKRRLQQEYDFPPKNYDACAGQYNVEYLNQPSVQTAIHAKRTYWLDCSFEIVLGYSIESMLTPMEPIYNWLITNAPELRIVIVSGDDDSVCGSLGTQSWIFNMSYNVDPSFNFIPWIHNNQVSGYITKFINAFNFITVHSAGHLIPQTQPSRSLAVLQKYINAEI